MRYKHNKTGNIYVLTGTAIDATNARADNVVAVYHAEGLPTPVYVRDWQEFVEKFTPVVNHPDVCPHYESYPDDDEVLYD